MKNINVKKVVAGAAALALGVGVLGAAIAANTGGEAFGSIAKGDIYNTTTMEPTVTIVTGSLALPQDDTWAQNIAAAIAENARLENPNYDPNWVAPVDGETPTTIESGELFDSTAIAIDPSTANFTESLDNDDYETLYDETIEGEFEDDDYDIDTYETIDVDGTLGFFTDKDSQSLMMLVGTGEIVYTADFSGSDNGGIPTDISAGDDLSVYFMGDKYKIQSIDDDEMTLVGSGGVQAYETGASISVTGTDGENYRLVVGNAYNDGESVRMMLMQGDTQVVAQMFDEDDTIEFDDYPLNESVAIVNVYDDTSTVNEDVVELSVGSGGLLILEDGEALPGYEDDDDQLWTVDFRVTEDVFLNEADKNVNVITQITVSNDDLVWDDYDLTKADPGLLPGEEIDLPLGLATVSFLENLTEEDTYMFEVGDNEVTWEDDDGKEHTVFLFEEDVEDSTLEIDGQEYYFIMADASTVEVYESEEDYDDAETPYYTAEAAHLGYVTVQLEIDNDIMIDYNVTIDDQDIRMVLAATNMDLGENTGATWAISGAEYQDDEAVSFSTVAITEKDANVTKFYIDNGTGYLVDTEDDWNTEATYPTDQADYESAWELDQEDDDDLTFAYTEYGSYVEVDGTIGKFTIPEAQRYFQVAIGGVSTTTTGGSTGNQTNPEDQYIQVTVDEEALVVTDAVNVSGTKIVVGGHLVNVLAENVTNTYLTQDGDYVMGKYTAGNIFVAGWTAQDTGAAATALINAIGSW